MCFKSNYSLVHHSTGLLMPTSIIRLWKVQSLISEQQWILLALVCLCHIISTQQNVDNNIDLTLASTQVGKMTLIFFVKDEIKDKTSSQTRNCQCS